LIYEFRKQCREADSQSPFFATSVLVGLQQGSQSSRVQRTRRRWLQIVAN
jgi:hypothetical protein